MSNDCQNSTAVNSQVPTAAGPESALFSMYGAGITRNLVPNRQGTILDVYCWMQDRKMAELTHQLRSIADPKAQQAFKRERLPYCTFGGQFSYRKESCLLMPSGLICMDFDHLGGTTEVLRVRQLLTDDPYFETQLLFTSPRGDGVKWVTDIDLSRATYGEWFDAISRYLRQTYGLDTDPAPRNICSACYLCHDPEARINPLVAPF